VTAVIYALVDELGQPRYVGQTAKPLRHRFARHLSNARGRSRPLDEWLRATPYASIVPLEVNPVEADEAERRWIRQMREGGVPLLNVYDGGRRAPTGLRHTAEARRRIGDARRGRSLSEDHRRKLSEAHSGVPLSPEHRAAIGRGGRGLVMSPEARENIAAAKRGQKNPMSRTSRALRGEVV